MDAYEFDRLDPVDRWEYFWEHGDYLDSVRYEGIDYFLFKHKVQKGLYMELYIVNATSEKNIKVIGGGDALVKYEYGQEDKPAPP